MAEAISSPADKRCLRYAVVTGGNKGIGFEVCKQLASEGVKVVLTARDEKRGNEALNRLKDSGLSENLVFHQLDVVDPDSIASLVDFIKSEFGKLDILVNNAGISGTTLEGDVLLFQEKIERDCRSLSLIDDNEQEGTEMKADGTLIQTHDLTEQCLQINYYGATRMIEAFIPLLQLSHSPRIVNVSSLLGKAGGDLPGETSAAPPVPLLSNEWAKGVLSDAESLTEERVDEVLNELLKDFKEGTVQAKGWPTDFTAYKASKAAMNAYTRIIAKKYPGFCINCLCPGYCKTDICGNTGPLTAAEGAESILKLALLPDGGPSGQFFFRKDMISF